MPGWAERSSHPFRIRGRITSRIEYACRLGARRAATWRESENASTLRPRRGAKTEYGALGGCTSICRVTNAWNGWSPLVWWSCTYDRPEPALYPQTRHGFD